MRKRRLSVKKIIVHILTVYRMNALEVSEDQYVATIVAPRRRHPAVRGLHASFVRVFPLGRRIHEFVNLNAQKCQTCFWSIPRRSLSRVAIRISVACSWSLHACSYDLSRTPSWLHEDIIQRTFDVCRVPADLRGALNKWTCWLSLQNTDSLLS